MNAFDSMVANKRSDDISRDMAELSVECVHVNLFDGTGNSSGVSMINFV